MLASVEIQTKQRMKRKQSNKQKEYDNKQVIYISAPVLYLKMPRYFTARDIWRCKTLIHLKWIS